MKKSTSLILAVLFVLSLFFTGCVNEPIETDPFADIPETPAEMFEYEDNEDGGITITKYIGEDTAVKIPAYINQKPITTIGYVAFSYKTTIVTIIVPNTVTTIDTAAFESCTFLTNVKLSNNLTTISNCAFEECVQLTDITLPDSLKELGNGAFQKCSALKYISIPENVTVLGESVFMESGLEKIELSNSITEIKVYTFYDTNLSSIRIPDSVKRIAFNAFGSCDSLESVDLGNGLVEIEESAFSGAAKLTEIIIPKTVTTVLDESFSYCSSLKAVKFEGDAPQEFRYILEGTTSDGEPAFLTAQDVHFTVYYHEGAKGFTPPEWNGYPTALW